jgi:hypothetical protein
VWDYDLPQAPKLLTIQQNGRPVQVVAQGSKQGFLYVFERKTGKPIWPIEERPVPKSDIPGEHASPTQPIPTRPAPYARQSFTEKDVNPFLPKEERDAVREKLRGLSQRRDLHAGQPAGHRAGAGSQRWRELGQLRRRSDQGRVLHRHQRIAHGVEDDSGAPNGAMGGALPEHKRHPRFRLRTTPASIARQSISG